MSESSGASAPRPVAPACLLRETQRREKMTVLTDCAYPLAPLADRAGIDCLLMIDLLGQVGLG